MPDGIKSLFASRKFWLTVCAVAIPIVNKKFGWELTDIQVAEAITPIVGLILGIAHEDSGKGPAEVPTK